MRLLTLFLSWAVGSISSLRMFGKVPACSNEFLLPVLFLASVFSPDDLYYLEYKNLKLEYLAVYGRASMGVRVGELQCGRTNGTVLDGHVRARRTVIGRRLGLPHNFFLSRTET